VGVVENLQLALANIPTDENRSPVVESLVKGVEMTAGELLRVLERNGIVRIDPPRGEKFNHNFHQAVAQVDDPGAEPNSIVQVLQAGYVIHDRLLRPAMVTVAKGGNSAQKVDTQA
jgi:molecular chaperone GrpE